MAAPTVTTRNPLALISFGVALVFPVLIAIRFLSLISALEFLRIVDGILGDLEIPAIIAAIVTGHIALAQSRVQRGFAVAGLVIGYLSFAFWLFVIFIFSAGAFFGQPTH